MSYCHKCGKKSEEKDSFCIKCGAKIGEFIEEIEEEVEELIKKTSYRGFFTFIFILILIGYVILDVWAVSQISPDFSGNSILETITNSNGNIGLSSTSASTKIVFENPTFVPVILFPITYKINYGENQIAEGKTDFIFIPSNSKEAISANIKISNSAVVGSFLDGIVNLATGNQEKITIDFYGLGIKFRSISP